jgi:hypothetical protein
MNPWSLLLSGPCSSRCWDPLDTLRYSRFDPFHVNGSLAGSVAGESPRDNVLMTVDAVVYFRVIDPAAAVVRVENYLKASSLISQTTLRNVLGQGGTR